MMVNFGGKGTIKRAEIQILFGISRAVVPSLCNSKGNKSERRMKQINKNSMTYG